MGNFAIKKGDTKPYIQVTLKDADLNAINLASAAVVFNMASASFANVIASAAVVTNAANGEVEYRWGATDTATPGKYYGEFEVTYADGKIETFPADNSLKINIYEDYD